LLMQPSRRGEGQKLMNEENFLLATVFADFKDLWKDYMRTF